LSAQSAAAPYARQVATSNKSRAAIFNGAKAVIAEVGNYQSNIAQIALRAQVSKATIYNQFADKLRLHFVLKFPKQLFIINLQIKQR